MEVSIKNQDSFLFLNPISNTYEAEKFSQNFIYWTSDADVYCNGIKQERMSINSESNVYTIGSYGVFDVESMTFTAFDGLENTTLTLYAHVAQYNKVFSKTINIKITKYEEVKNVSIQGGVSEIEFSSLKQEYSLIAYATNQTATNKEVLALYSGGQIVVDENTYSMIENVEYIESAGKYQIKFVVSKEFVEKAQSYQGEMRGTILIVAKDWVDNGVLRSEYADYAKQISYVFANGTLNNRFSISTAEELVEIKQNLSAHYKITTNIDVSSVNSLLPLGELKGSIIGTNEYSTISGLNITKPLVENVDDATTCYYGLFSKISNGAYIEYVNFEGIMQISSNEKNVFAGLVAGINEGSLINVGVTLGASNVIVCSGNIGGVVGQNEGEIIQDFTLFEDNTSFSRTLSESELETNGRISYANMSPKVTVENTDVFTVYYNEGESETSTNVGGIAGQNNGTIKKIDSTVVTFSGYLNYMGKVNIKLIPSDSGSSSDTTTFTKGNVGGLVGQSTGKLFAGYNAVDSGSINEVKFNYYSSYKYINKTSEIIGDFSAGDGVIVGGEVWGYSNVGGVIGVVSNEINSNEIIAGITSRVYVRGLKAGGQEAKIAGIANITKSSTISSAFAMQAVDDGRSGIESSMMILYNNSYNSSFDGYFKDSDKLAFGLNFNLDIMQGVANAENENKNYKNVLSYLINRNYVEIPENESGLNVSYGDTSIYYGNMIVCAVNNGIDRVLKQTKFAMGENDNLTINGKFNNVFTGEDASSNKNILYMYYFKAGIADENNDINAIQSLLDLKLNNINQTNKFYPFEASGNMTFVSKTTDILTIAPNGKITVKKTGLAEISGTSVLNSNNALNFYIYVTNYINSESTEKNDNRSSVVYPNQSSSSVAFEDSTITLRGTNTATIYVVPKYDYVKTENDESGFTSTKQGEASINGMVFTLASNDDVSAKISVSDDSAKEYFSFEVVGPIITIRRNSAVKEGEYNLNIVPVLSISVNNDNGNKEKYYTQINKSLTDTKIDYKQGAISIQTKNYNQMSLTSSKNAYDEVLILSTDIEILLLKYP